MKGMQASPNFRKAWAVTQVAGHLWQWKETCPYKWKKLPEEGDGEPLLLAFGGDTGNAERGTEQDDDKDSGLGQAHNDTELSGSPSGESTRAGESGNGAGQGDRLGRILRERAERERSNRLRWK